MKIRPFEEKDRAATITLWQQCGLVVPHNDPNKDIDRKLKVDADLFLVGVDNNKIVASVMGGYEGHRGWINYLAVSPEHQRKGYGQAMMQSVEELILAKGCPKINLQVRNSNQAVIAFYNAIGYGQDQVISLGKRLEHDN